MSKGCCGGANCGCRIIQGTDAKGNNSLRVTGVGSTADPIIIRGAAVDIGDTTDIDLTIAYDDLTNKYVITANFGPASKLDALGDVVATAPANNQVLGYDTATGKWTPRNPTTAASGSVAHDLSLSGDGSSGSQLTVRHAPNRFTATSATSGAEGIGLTNTGINSLVRRFATVADRLATTIAPAVNTLSITEDRPGRIDYWDGDSWENIVILTGEGGVALAEQSGSYVDSAPVIGHNALILDTTDADGRITVLDADLEPLASAAGILDYTFQLQEGYPYLVGYEIGVDGSLNLIFLQLDVSTVSWVPASGVQVRGKLRAMLY